VILYAVSLGEGGKGVAVGEFGRIFRTADGGKTWESAQSPIESSLFALCQDGDSFYAAGLDGILVYSRDGGQTWQKVDTGITEPIYAIAVRGSEGWAAGDVGTVLHSSDGGLTWQPSDVPTKKRLYWIGTLSLGNASQRVGFGAGANGLFVGIQEGQLIW
jgi:photosystem II stability/assembly factor-like uncharacterized protein